ncbi:asparagine synthase (glutamine-hydrolyzing) [Sulfurimonas sp.]
MCAIFGVLGEYDSSKARFALQQLSHRGPDSCSIVEKRNLFFAHQELSIMNRQNKNHQPYKYKNILLSFNGEIYNFKELKKELDFEFQRQDESELLVAAYLKWGVDFVTHLRGMFSIALLDGEKLYLFRDRLGKKPLFFMQDTKAFYFASEIKALKPFLSHTKINNDALLSYLSYLAPTPPHTFYEGIYKLAAGEYLLFEKNTYSVKRYFDLLEANSNIITEKSVALSLLEQTLQDSISMRLDADVSIASLLSGGIDSATINYYAKKQGKNLQTYTIGYEGFSKYDERQNAAKSAKILALHNKAVVINQEDFINATEAVFDALDEPLNDPASVPLYLLFQAIKKDGHTVVMSGEGSDELFLGYRQYFEYLDIEKARELTHKNWLKKYFRSNFSMNREWEWYKRVFDDTLLFRTSGDKFTDLQKNLLLKQNIKDNSSLSYLQSYRNRFEQSQYAHDESLWYSYIDLNLFQAEHFLMKLDRVSMAHSIESRTPFLDHKLALNIFKIDPKLRYKDSKTKALLKEIMQPYLGDEILSRKKKGFSNPYMEYLINSKKISLIQEVNKQSGMFYEKELEKYLQHAKKGSFKQHVWGLYALSHWIKKNLL